MARPSITPRPFFRYLTMALEPKERASGEIRAQIKQIENELLDTSKHFSPDDLKSKGEALASLKNRMRLLEGITPEAEIKAQHGDEETLRVASPENQPDEDYPARWQERYTTLCRTVAQAFGTTGNYLSVLTGRTKANARQLKVMNEVMALTRSGSTIIGTASDSSGGEFLLPLQQVAQIFRVENIQQGILQGARRYPVAGRTLRIPYVKQTDASVDRPMAGISKINIIGEGSTIDEDENVFAQRLLTVYKYAAITKLSDEIMQDDLTSEVVPTVMSQIGQEVLNQMNFDMTISGSGTSNSLGALHANNAALIKVTRLQQNKINTVDVFSMYAQFTGGPNSRWFISRTALPSLFGLTVGGTSFVTFLQNLRDNPMGATLLGYPVVITDFSNALGSISDIALVNPDFYAAAVRQQLTVESSIHVAFTTDLVTYRFIARGGGTPIPDGTYAYRSVTGTKVAAHSPFVTLDSVYSS